MGYHSRKSQIPSDLVVKSQATDIIGLLLQLFRHPNGVHRSCHHRKSRGAVLSTSAVQWLPLNSMECGKCGIFLAPNLLWDSSKNLRTPYHGTRYEENGPESLFFSLDAKKKITHLQTAGVDTVLGRR